MAIESVGGSGTGDGADLGEATFTSGGSLTMPSGQSIMIGAQEIRAQDGAGLIFGDLDAGDVLWNQSGVTSDRTITIPDASGTITLGGNTFSGTGSVARATAPQLTNVNVTDAALSLNGAKLQSFALYITNDGGTLKHRIAGETSTVTASAYADKISGASPTLAATPSVDAATGFASGAGIDAAATNRIIFDTAAQTDAKFLTLAVIEGNTTATSGLLCNLRNISSNVNGTTRNRLALSFATAATVAHGMTTANIANGTFIRVRVIALIE